MSHPEIWRQRVWVWLPALVFFLLNLAAFAVYRLGYAGNIQSLETELDGQHHELATLKARQRELDSLLLRADANRRRVEELYDDRFSTRRRRLTEVTAEVLSLARRAGLAPEILSYPEQEIEDYGLIKRSFVFSVSGTYLELRKFVNLLELSDSFLTLEDASMTQDPKGSELRMSLRLSTLFAKEGAQPLGGGPVKRTGGTS
jgi:type IV pilus assembly protein PilO